MRVATKTVYDKPVTVYTCERVRVHKEQIKYPAYRKIPLSRHLDICGKGKFKIIPFFKCNRKDNIYRQEMERYFIKLFNPKLNA